MKVRIVHTNAKHNGMVGECFAIENGKYHVQIKNRKSLEKLGRTRESDFECGCFIIVGKENLQFLKPRVRKVRK